MTEIIEIFIVFFTESISMLFNVFVPFLPFIVAMVVIRIIVGMALGTFRYAFDSFVSTRLGAAITLLVIAGVVVKQGFL